MKQIINAGIVASLPGTLPLQAIVPVSDALLAAPVLGVEVAFNGEQGMQLISDLCKRANGKMVIGAGHVETAVQAQAAIDAGAHFITSPRLDFDLMALCGQRDVLYVPSVISVLAAQAVQQAGGTFVRLRTGGSGGPDYVTTIQQVIPGMRILVTGDVTVENIDRYAKAGADAVIIGNALVETVGQPMADIISRARKLQKAWVGGRQKRPFNPFQPPSSPNPRLN